MQGKLTIQGIARLARVSKARVSCVLNHHPSVDPVLTNCVLEVIKEHNFVSIHHLTVFHQQGPPLVIIDDQEAPTNIPWMGVDNCAIASTAS